MNEFDASLFGMHCLTYDTIVYKWRIFIHFFKHPKKARSGTPVDLQNFPSGFQTWPSQNRRGLLRLFYGVMSCHGVVRMCLGCVH